MNHAIRTLRELSTRSIETIISAHHLESRFAGKQTAEIKREKRTADGQYSPSVQRELSLRGQRTAFVEFHGFMFSLSDMQLQSLKKAYKQFHLETQDDQYSYVDKNLINDAIDYQICIRAADGFDIQHTSKDVLESWRHNARIAEQYPEITSGHLISLVEQIRKIK